MSRLVMKANADMLDYFVKKFQREGLYKEGMEKQFDQKEVAMGMQVEREHTSSKELLREIVLDHLVEDAHYYTKLEKWKGKMEKAKKMPIGTISHGRKKVAEGRWVPVTIRKEKVGASSAIDRHKAEFKDSMITMMGQKLSADQKKKLNTIAEERGTKLQRLLDTVGGSISFEGAGILSGLDKFYKLLKVDVENMTVDISMGNKTYTKRIESLISGKEKFVTENQKSIGEARMNLVIPLTKGAAGTRGVPDGSGPEGKGPTGRKLGGCPKREDYKNEFEYNAAMLKWKAKNKTEKSIVYMPTEMLKGDHLGKVGSTQSHLNKVGSSTPEHKGSAKGKGNAKGTTSPQKPTGGGTTDKPKGAPKAESSKKGGSPSRVKGRKPGDKPPYKNYKATASGSGSSAASNYLKMTSVKDGKARFLKLGSIHRAKFDHAGNCIQVTVDGKRYPVQNHLVKIPSGVFRIDGMVTVADKVTGAKK